MQKKSREQTHIVILGGGFGGVYSYIQLDQKFRGDSNVLVTMISKDDRFLFVPMIHEVATGNLLPSSITQSLYTLPKHCHARFVRGTVNGADLDKQVVSLKVGGLEKAKSVEFDYLVSALGSDTNFFNTPGAKEHALTLKDLDDARAVKNRMIESFEQALWTTDSKEQKRLLHFVIVGGGPTGVELAGEMADYLRDELNRAFPQICPIARVSLIQSGEKLMPQADKWFSENAERALRKMNVEIIFESRVSRITDGGAYIGEKLLAAGTVVWTAGVKANRIDITAAKGIDYEERSDRIKVNDFLQLANYPNVFVVGDMAWVCDKETRQPYPMRAQFAVREGEVAGENVYRLKTKKALKEFEWRDKGFIVSLAKGAALAELFGVKFSGFPAWWAYRTAYLGKLVGWRAKVRTAVEWTMNLFLPRDVSKL